MHHSEIKVPIVFGGGALACPVLIHEKVNSTGSACVCDAGLVSRPIFFSNLVCKGIIVKSIHLYLQCIDNAALTVLAFTGSKVILTMSKFAKMLKYLCNDLIVTHWILLILAILKEVRVVNLHCT